MMVIPNRKVKRSIVEKNGLARCVEPSQILTCLSVGTVILSRMSVREIERFLSVNPNGHSAWLRRMYNWIAYNTICFKVAGDNLHSPRIAISTSDTLHVII
jgi:hypothetical protein